MRPSNPRRFAVAVLLLISITTISWSCRRSPPPVSRLLPDLRRAPADVREACELTALKCSRCHTIDRILVAPVASADGWDSYVKRMRRMPTSGISAADGEVILRCLRHRTEGGPP